MKNIPNTLLKNLEMRKLQDTCPVMVTDIPYDIIEEIDGWVKESKKFKNHPLAELKAHENVGYLALDGKKHNSYQCCVSPHLIEPSFWLAWVLRLTHKYWGGDRNRKEFKLNKWDGHYDAYDLWSNFSYKGDDNPTHNHPGFLSGVIYYKNHGHPTIFDDYECEYEGKDGTMIMFPSRTLHHVKPQTIDEERITFAFNISETYTMSKGGYSYALKS